MLRVNGGICVSDGVVCEWCKKCNDGRTDVYDEEVLGHNSVALLQQVDEMIREYRRFTITGLSVKFPEVSRSSFYSIATEYLGYRKHCAHWVTKQLTNAHKTRQMASALSFLERYQYGGKRKLKPIVTGD